MKENEILAEREKLKEQIEKYHAFVDELNVKIMEVHAVINSLKEISKIKKKKKMLVPLANGIFLNAELENNSDLIVNVGANVCVHKSIIETITILKKRLNDIKKQKNDVEQIMQQLIFFLENFEEEVN